MKIAVLGAGIVGITTAYQLLKDGHQVTVIDREPEPANFTSFSNAGLVAPGHAYAWASPAAPGMMWRSQWRNDQAIRFKPRLDTRQWSWIRKFLSECTAERAVINTRNKARLSIYSQQMLNEVGAETRLPYDRVSGGLLYFFRTPASFERGSKKADLLRNAGIKIDTLSSDEIIAKDPGLRPAAQQIAGGLYVKSDEGGDCRIFAHGLAEKCRAMGADIKLGTTITRIETRNGEVTHVETSAGRIAADAFVLALGVFSPDLAKQLGIRLPVYPVKGYAMTIPISDKSKVARLGGVDEDNLLAYCPFDGRLRVTATAEIAGYDNSHKPSDFRVMKDRTARLFPEGLDWATASYWAGLRPMTPTAMPIVDRSPISNLWLNTGHGHMGWTMSNGSARILADLIGQRRPAIDTEGLRYEH
ncbi:MAG: D-amino acid dehydrogenase [Hyphomicrobiaceae bacterium]